MPHRLLPLLILLPACSPAEPVPTVLDDAFTDAGAAHGVPAQLLGALAWTQSRLDGRGGAPSVTGGVGIFDLRPEGELSVERGASLSGLDAEAVASQDRANTFAAAALLDARAREVEALTGNPVDDWEEWYPIVAWFSGADDPLVAEGFADQVFDWLQGGVLAEAPSGEVVTIDPVPMPWRRTAVTGSGLIAQYVPACSSNYSDYARGGGDIDTIVIHTVEGSYSGAISWMQNCASQVSAHYVVRSSDGQITQMVQEEDVAWHAGHWDTNERSIGIEHEGYVSDPGNWYTDSMYRASAALVRDIADRYGIPKDRGHVIAHSEVPGCAYEGGGGSGCHTDPGEGWDWDYFMSLVNESGEGSTSMGGSGLGDGPRSGSFSATVTSLRYGETDTCSGPLTGSVTGGQLYLAGTCTLDRHPEKSGELPVAWSGTATGTALDGRMVVDGRSASFTGEVGADGSVSARIAGSEDLGGDVGVLEYEVVIEAR